MPNLPLHLTSAREEQRIKILLVDDHPLFRAGVRQRLSEHDTALDVVGEAENAGQALEMVAALLPDVVLMDIAMSTESGIVATQKIKQTHPKVVVVILSLYNDVQYIEAAVRAGATGYLLKTVQGLELARAVRSAFNGEAVMSQEISSKVFQQLLPQLRNGRQPLTDQQLSERELEVLSQVARGAPNKEIAKSMQLSVRTVDSHLRSIFSKLQATSRTEAVILAVKAGRLRLDEVQVSRGASD
jgi:DNA-binding NarL/FixJ family response regulator